MVAGLPLNRSCVCRASKPDSKMVTISPGAMGPDAIDAAFTRAAAPVSAAAVAAVKVRMRLLPLSAIRTAPSGPIARSEGAFNCAEVARSPSPEKPAPPVPAMVVSVPQGVKRRMTFLPDSAMSKPPAAFTARPRGASRPPISVLMAPAGVTFHTCTGSLTSTSPLESTATAAGWICVTVVVTPEAVTLTIRLLPVSAI